MGKEVDVDEVLIHSYSRKQAIEDGILVDVSEMAREAGFRVPVALTQAVYERYVQVPKGVSCQDEKGRLWDVLSMLRFEIIRATDILDKNTLKPANLRFEVLVRNDNQRADLVHLKSVCGPGDDGEPVITIMLPSED
jgi:hypothetical protein